MDHIKYCRACSSERIETFFDLGNQPFANCLLKEIHFSEKSYPLSLSWCPECNLVQLNQTADPRDLFSEYVWVTGTSSVAREYSVKFSEDILARSTGIREKEFILEVASNDGTFLKPFIRGGYKVLGVDPAENIVKSAVAEGVPTKCGFFGQAMAREIVDEHGYPTIILVRNVLPHVANLHDFLNGLQLCLNNDGLLAIEVHYAKVILDELHYDSIYHEHLCYFSLKSIEKLLNDHGLFIFDIAESLISGGSIVLYLKKKALKQKQPVQIYRDNEKKLGTNEIKSWRQFADKAFSHKKQLLNLLTEEKKEGGIVIGYGASARSSTMLNFCNIGRKYISMIADQNPLKHKCFTPGTHILIDSPGNVMETNPNTVFVLAWNFLKEIAGHLKTTFKFNGKLIVPFPYPPKVMNVEEVMNGRHKG